MPEEAKHDPLQKTDIIWADYFELRGNDRNEIVISLGFNQTKVRVLARIDVTQMRGLSKALTEAANEAEFGGQVH